jgi:hypothetical protein
VDKQSISSELTVQHWLTRTVEADDVKGVLPNIDAIHRDSFNALLHSGLLPQLLGYSVLPLESERTIPLLLSPERRHCAVDQAQNKA